jgi:hypothetical protein
VSLQIQDGPRRKRKYKLVLPVCKQALKQITEKAIRGFVFTARHRWSQGTCTYNISGDETTWRDCSDEPHTETQDLLVKDEDTQAMEAAGCGGPLLAKNSFGRPYPKLMSSAIGFSFGST